MSIPPRDRCHRTVHRSKHYARFAAVNAWKDRTRELSRRQRRPRSASARRGSSAAGRRGPASSTPAWRCSRTAATRRSPSPRSASGPRCRRVPSTPAPTSKDALFLAVYEHGIARLVADQAIFDDQARWADLPADELAAQAVHAVADIFIRHAALLRSRRADLRRAPRGLSARRRIHPPPRRPVRRRRAARPRPDHPNRPRSGGAGELHHRFLDDGCAGRLRTGVHQSVDGRRHVRRRARRHGSALPVRPLTGHRPPVYGDPEGSGLDGGPGQLPLCRCRERPTGSVPGVRAAEAPARRHRRQERRPWTSTRSPRS